MKEHIRIAVYGRPLSCGPRMADIVSFLSKLDSVSSLYISKEFLSSVGGFSVASERVFTGAADFPCVDILVSVGGDGTFLDCVSLVRNTNIPIWGVNIGRLGFLTYTSLDDVNDALDALLKGCYTIDTRAMLKVDTGTGLASCISALNEVTIQKQDASMITVHAYIDEEFLGTYWSDGVIVATPTGSTAYSMSNGGPIVDPHSSVFVISPIAPHNLNMRPLVVPDSAELRLVVESRTGTAIWSMDNHRFLMKSGDSIRLKKSEDQIRIVKFRGTNFCANLRNKLLWGLDKRN